MARLQVQNSTWPPTIIYMIPVDTFHSNTTCTVASGKNMSWKMSVYDGAATSLYTGNLGLKPEFSRKKLDRRVVVAGDSAGGDF